MEMKTEKPKPRIGVGVVLIKEGKVLLGKRKGAHGAGSWSLAGGHLEFGESPESCAKRELEEETGIKGLSFQVGPWTNDIIEQNKHYITIFVFVDQFEVEPKLLEPEKCEGWHWFDWTNLPSPIFPPVLSLIQKMGIETLSQASSEEKKQQALLEKLLAFYKERDWEQFHSPKNLVMDLTSEVGELAEHFRWLTEEQSANLDDNTKREVQREIADVFKVILYLSHKLGIDPIKASENKLEEMSRKYPVDLCKGKALKYTAYESILGTNTLNQ